MREGLLAYDAVLRRPGCVLIQAGYGGDSLIANRFPPESWLLAPTENMRLYRVTESEIIRLVEMAEAVRKGDA